MYTYMYIYMYIDNAIYIYIYTHKHTQTHFINGTTYREMHRSSREHAVYTYT